MTEDPRPVKRRRLTTRTWRVRIPTWAWDDLILKGDLLAYVHRRIDEVAKAQDMVRVPIGAGGRYVWLTRKELKGVLDPKDR